MKTTLITAALVLSTVLATAQEKKQATVHIKKIENINGVEKVIDTTYTTDDLSVINAGGERIEIIQLGDDKEGTKRKIFVNGKEGEEANVKIIRKGEAMDEEVEKALKEAGVDLNSISAKKMVIVNDDNKTSKHETKIVIIKQAKITEANEADLKKINQDVSKTDGKLAMDNMNFYPNPNTGKFNLSFSLADKGDAEITVLNMEGKKVYSEKLPNFTGTYDKEIDISKNPTGVYFVKISQGDHSQVKKIVLE